MNNNAISIAQIVAAFKRHQVKAVTAWMIVMLVFIAAFVMMPRKYGSEGRLYIQMGRNNTGISPSSGSNSISIQDTRETEIRSVVEIIGSRAVLESVVDEIGADEILKSRFDGWLPGFSVPGFLSSGNDDGMSADEYNTQKKREQAAKCLESSTTIHAEKKTSVISVYVKANSAKLAQRIVNKIFERTRAVHLKIHASKGSADFFDDQFERQQKEVVQAVRELSQYRNRMQILSVSASRETLQGILARLDADLMSAEVSLAESEQRLAKLTELMVGTTAQIAIPKSGVERHSYELARTELFRLESERERLISTYQASHPDVKQIEIQLAQLKKSLENMSADRTESAMMSNPVYEAIQVDFLRAKADKAAFTARLNSLSDKKALAIKQLEKMNEAEIEADQLARNVEIARQYLAIYTQKRGESKAMSLLDDLDISDVVVAQDANFVVKHISPRGSIVLPLGFICGMFAAMATALFFERNHLSASLNEGDVEQILDLPVLVTLPRVYSSRNMVN